MAWKARIELRRTEDGGRHFPRGAVFWCPVQFPHEHQLHDARFRVIGKELVQPGEGADVLMDFLAPHTFEHPATVGDEFEIWEGPHLTAGKGVLLAFVDGPDKAPGREPT